MLSLLLYLQINEAKKVDDILKQNAEDHELRANYTAAVRNDLLNFYDVVMQDFIWYELMTPDPEGAVAFYRELTGWTVTDVGGPQMTYYAAGMGAGTRGICGITALPVAMREAGARPGWLGYLGTEDIGMTIRRLEAAGGSLRREPMEIPGTGTFAVVTDPQGAVFQLMQPAPQGAILPQLEQGAVGNVGWAELMTTDQNAAWQFYSGQFGWTLGQSYDMGPAGRYQTFSSNDQPMTGGMMTIPEHLRAHMPHPFWSFYFNVQDIREAQAKIEAMGGKVEHGPAQVPGGGWIINGVDPQGVHFALLSRNG